MAKFSVKRPFTVLVGVVMILVLGYVSFRNLTTDLLPEMSLPYVMVITSYPGASPERVESEVTEPLESGLGRVNGIVNVTSTSQENMSMVVLEFEEDTNMDGAMVKLSSQLDLLTLPDEVGNPMLLELSPDLLATMMVTVDYEGMDVYELSEFVEDTVVPYLERQDGVASVDLTGSVEQRVEIRLDQAKIDKINAKLRAKAEDALADSEQELADARQELEDAKQELVDSRQELEDSKSELRKSKKELEDAEDELNAQSKKLKNQQDDTSEELAKASKLMNEALATQKAYEANLSALQANQAALTAEKEQYQKAIDQVNETLAQLQRSLGTAIRAATLNQILSGLDEMTREYMGGLPESVDASDSDAVDAVWSQLLSMEGFGDSLAAVDENIDNLPGNLDEAMDNNGEKLFALQAMLEQAGQSEAAAQLSYENLSNLKNGQDVRIPEIDTELANLVTEIAVAEEALKQVNDAVDEALEKYEEVEAGKISAAAAFGAGQAQIAMGKAQVESGKAQVESGEKQIESGEEQLKDGEKQIESSEEQLEDAEKSLADARKTALDNANLDALLDLETLSALLTAENFDMPVGYVDDGNGTDVLVKVGEQFADMEEIENLVLTHIDDIGDIRVSDVAYLEVTDNAQDSYARVNGNQALMISVTKASTAGTAAVSDTVNDALVELTEKYDGLHFVNLMDQGEYIDLIVDSVLSNLMWGALLAILVLVIFLKDPRPTAVVAFSIPLSVLFAVVLMYFSDITLNIISLSGLALGVGMLVDNSIVVMENIYRLRGLGVSPASAAVKGAGQVGAAIASSTLTTICVFLPIVFTKGLTRQLFTDMGLTIAYSLTASLIVAMTVVPAMSATALKNVKERPHRFFDAMMVGYENVLRICLRVKILPIAIALGLLGYCLFEVTRMGLILLPDMGGYQMSMTMTAPDDLTQEEAYAAADDFMNTMMGTDGVQDIGLMSGSAGISLLTGGSGSTSFSAYLLLNEETADDNSVIADRIDEYFADSDWEYTVATSNMNISSLLASGMDIEITGRDMDQLITISEDMMQILEENGGFEEISNAQEAGSPTWRILVDKTAAMRLNLTVAQVYQELSARLATDKTTTTLVAEEGEYAVHIVDETKTLNMDNIMDMLFTTTKVDDEGKEVKEEHALREFAVLAEGISVGSITRENQSRYIHVTASAREGENVTLLSRDVQEKLDQYTLPDGYSVHIGGETESVRDSMIDMLKMIGLAVVFIYLIMVAQFQSLLSPFIVLFTIPLAFTGGLLALLLTGEQISIVCMMGFLVLTGVVVNNGIVFVDYTNQLRLSGMERKEALAETGKRRMRPILMTAMTTILAMITMAMDQGFQGTMGRGMAIVTIGGLAYATLMTLFIIPVLYDLFFRRELHQADLSDLDAIDDDEIL